MQDIPCILTEWQELNSLLYAPLSATKRVQYTCLAVSTNFIVLGATSGSVYLFAREPCTFQQLIPLSEGAMCQAQISPDEKSIALATVRGSICLVSLKPNIKLLTVSTEHVGEKITSLCWNDNSSEVFAGDENGKVTVTVLPSFTYVNGMFQSSSFALMDLDSKIVQMNFDSSLLLISTLNCCYICDTVYEQYKAIGNKPRDGEFGACFFRTHNSYVETLEESRQQEYASSIKQVFSMNDEEVENEFVPKDCLPKIYCARPGSRLWDVTATGTVTKTHQFKEALAIAPLPVYKPSIGKSFRLRNQNQPWLAQSINFPQLHVINHRFIFSYTSNGLYVFDPENAKVVLWNDEFPDIFMAHIVNDKIYLMTSSGVFHCLTLACIDSLILKLHERKLYKECLEMCQILRPQYMNSIDGKLCDLDITQGASTPEILVPIISLIKSNLDTQPLRLESGIVLVNAGDRDLKKDSMSFSNRRLEVTQNLDEIEDLFSSLNTDNTTYSSVVHVEPKKEKLKNEKNVERTNDDASQVVKEDNDRDEEDSATPLSKTMCSMQADLASLYLSIGSEMTPDITVDELKALIENFFKTLESVKEKYEVSNELKSYLDEIIRSAELYYCNSLLEHLPIELIDRIDEVEVLEQIVKMLSNVNESKHHECCCGFPYPVFDSDRNKPVQPNFYNVGKALLQKLSVLGEDTVCLKMCNQIPFMWRDYLDFKGYPKKHIPDDLLRHCIQVRDSLLTSTVLPVLDNRQWKLVSQCLDRIKDRRCINCNRLYDIKQASSKEFSIDWTGVIQSITKKQGPRYAMSFLSKIHKNLPRVSFDKSVYQSIIFSTLLSHHGVEHTVDLEQNQEPNSVCSPKVRQELIQSVEQDLEKPVNKNILGSGPHHWGMRYNLASSTCPCCTLSLQTPVLLGNNGIALFPCGHAYHVNCMIQKKISRCNLHTNAK
ncbi:hypothetical protein QAD02_011215 [Eretmocerus hayati]|uniref:Uncharacterized protein n=1 Tax=Eretmocerus hayati TaxID=131215 RepID=A0ACC2NVZ2_9HYME|nr:hypothetical protein QAD02_011215 [Eretmocerus hayati]